MELNRNDKFVFVPLNSSCTLKTFHCSRVASVSIHIAEKQIAFFAAFDVLASCPPSLSPLVLPPTSLSHLAPRCAHIFGGLWPDIHSRKSSLHCCILHTRTKPKRTVEKVQTECRSNNPANYCRLGKDCGRL